MRIAPLLPILLLTTGALGSADILRDARTSYEAGDLAGAIRLYREFLSDHTDAAEIRSNLGAALVRNGQFVEAIGEYRKAIEDLPANRPVRTNLALAYYKVGRLANAMAELEFLLRQNPLDLQAALLLADATSRPGSPPPPWTCSSH